LTFEQSLSCSSSFSSELKDLCVENEQKRHTRGKNCFVNLRDEMPLSPPFKEMFSKANICHRWSSVKQQLSFQNKKTERSIFFRYFELGLIKREKTSWARKHLVTCFSKIIIINKIDKNIRLPKICPVLSSFTLYLKTAATAQLNTKA
jgi:hypothetical protein